LPEEKELAELDEIDLLTVLLHPANQGLGLAHRQRVRPFIPGRSIITVPDRPKEGVVGEPVPIFFTKCGELPHQLGGLGVTISNVGPTQQAELERFDLVELDPLGREFRHLGHLRIGEDTVLHQQIRADEELVAGKGGDGRVGRISRPRRVQWQDLPPRRASASQPFHVGRGGGPEVADPISGRQRGGMEDNSGGTVVHH
jgi:hypothetical protein